MGDDRAAKEQYQDRGAARFILTRTPSLSLRRTQETGARVERLLVRGHAAEARALHTWDGDRGMLLLRKTRALLRF
jgi:hypothetical protein